VSVGPAAAAAARDDYPVVTPSGYLLLGLTAIVGALAGILAFAAARFLAAAREVSRRGSRDGAGEAFVASAVQDALGRLKAQEQAARSRAEASERLSAQVLASMSSGVLVVDGSGRVRTLNPAAAALLRLEEDAAGRLAPEVLARAGALADVVATGLSEGRPIVRRSVTIETPDGARHFGVTVSPIHDGETVDGVICLFTDLTEIVDLEEQLRMKDSLARLGELTAGIAHEFRNGLATIHGYGRLLDPNQLPDAARPCVEGIRAETKALGDVVTRFLEFARPVTPVLAPVDVRTLLERVIDDLRGEIAARGGEVLLTGTFAPVDGDDVLLRQAFANLCRNALEACAGAGTIPRITVDGALDPDHHAVRIAITDNGPGIAPGDEASIFRPFFTTRSEGTGLGLALVQKIAVVHNGRVSAGNAPGGGARFVLTLPASAAADRNC
jgi:PAS domain S-box-containing protein